MSPEIKLSESQHGFISDILRERGLPLEGDPFEITLGNGERQVVVLTETSLVSNGSVVSGFEKIIKGTEVFGCPSTQEEESKKYVDVPLYTGDISDDLTIEELFEGIDSRFATRIRNTLARSGFRNVVQIQDLLIETGEKEFMNKVNNFGLKSYSALKQRLGLT